MTSDGQPYAVAKFRAIVQEQVMLGYLTKGGVTFGDSEQMTPYERTIALEVMKEILDKQNGHGAPPPEQPYKNDPKSRLTSGM